MAVVVSEEQGEVEKFRKWDLDIKPHRKLLKEGFELADGKRIDRGYRFQAGRASVPHRHRVRDVADGLRRSEPRDTSTWTSRSRRTR